jgi:predicted site-specific integrase-resolvase
MTTATESEFVGASEAADLLGVRVGQITRWSHSGKMPTPAAELAATKVWHRTDIEAMAREEAPSRPRRISLVGTAEAAELLEVNKSQIGRWRRAGTFPEPVAQLASGPLWKREQITRFAKSRS